MPNRLLLLFKKLRRPSKADVLVAAVTLAVGLFVGVAINNALQPDVWDPLGPYPVQKVESQGEKVRSPSSGGAAYVARIELGSKVHVFGRKCADEELTIKGAYGWRSVDPAGFFHEVAKNASGYRLKGCSDLDFRNDIPKEVDTWARSVIANGKKPEVFIGGCEIPQKGTVDGREICWRTERFVLVLP